MWRGKWARKLSLFIKQILSQKVFTCGTFWQRQEREAFVSWPPSVYPFPSFKSKPPTPSLAFGINCTVILKLIPNCFTTHREKRANQLLFCFHLTEGDIMQMIFTTWEGKGALFSSADATKTVWSSAGAQEVGMQRGPGHPTWLPTDSVTEQ